MIAGYKSIGIPNVLSERKVSSLLSPLRFDSAKLYTNFWQVDASKILFQSDELFYLFRFI